MLKETIFEHKRHFAEGAESELRAQHNAMRRVTLLNGELTANTRTDHAGVSARVRRNGVYGFASIGDFSDASIERVLQEATSNATVLSNHARSKQPPLPAPGTGMRPLIESFHDVEQRVYVETCRAVDRYITEHCPELISRVVLATSDTVEKVIATSDGYDAHVVIPRSYIYVVLTAMSKEGTPVEVFRPIGGYGTLDENFTDLEAAHAAVDQTYEHLMKKREAVYTEAGLKTVILSGTLAGMLAHEAVGHTVEADLVLGGSVAQHLMDQPVASEMVSLVDYAHTAFGKPAPLPVYVDDEGVVAEDAVLIEDGLLKGYMHNRESAEHFGTRPQGNARAWLFSDEPLIRMRNTAILPGNDTIEDMIASIDDGYYFMDTNNGQADTTGEFMFGVTVGYEIKNGKLGRAVFDTTISGVAFDMLKTVDMLSADVEWASSGFCGKKQIMPVGLGGPAVRCQLTVGGR
ncbi:MAG: TldD/PmbA family protein [Saccharofermentanales bacterium]|jgi:TldD protein